MYLKEGDGAVLNAERSYRIHIVLMTILTVILGLMPFLLTNLL
jgi:Cu/Ag efflux pump CusA